MIPARIIDVGNMTKKNPILPKSIFATMSFNRKNKIKNITTPQAIIY